MTLTTTMNKTDVWWIEPEEKRSAFFTLCSRCLIRTADIATLSGGPRLEIVGERADA